MNAKGLIILLGFLLTFGCSTTRNLTELPSGKKIAITSITRMEFPKGEPTLVLTYETKISIENKPELREEVGEIWEVFRKDVEVNKLNAGAIRAVHAEGNNIMKNGYGFLFLKRDDGTWYCVDDE